MFNRTFPLNFLRRSVTQTGTTDYGTVREVHLTSHPYYSTVPARYFGPTPPAEVTGQYANTIIVRILLLPLHPRGLRCIQYAQALVKTDPIEARMGRLELPRTIGTTTGNAIHQIVIDVRDGNDNREERLSLTVPLSMSQ
jgi:hypothetical protein